MSLQDSLKKENLPFSASSGVKKREVVQDLMLVVVVAVVVQRCYFPSKRSALFWYSTQPFVIFLQNSRELQEM